jgi:hypothetical protein
MEGNHSCPKMPYIVDKLQHAFVIISLTHFIKAITLLLLLQSLFAEKHVNKSFAFFNEIELQHFPCTWIRTSPQ